ncbi:MAG: GPW/gp25 family protein [Synergistaceae bacterium]|nr:GPW/gp25 family protein [Synergistaceae bacterium]
MQYQVSGANDGNAVDFSPPGVAEEVLQNVRTLLVTAKYSVPLDRDLGIDASFLDRPAPDAMARLRVQIAQEIQRHEPRAVVKVIEFKKYEDEALSGCFYPVLRIEVIGG